MKFTLSIPIDTIEPSGEFQTGEALREMATAIERAGIDACFVTDHPAPTRAWRASPEGHDALDPFSALSFVAAATQRLKVHANVVVLPYRNPFIVAKAASTLQILSGGRLIMGVAAGYLREEFEALGVDPSRRGALTDEALETLRAIWSGEPVTRQGIAFKAVEIMPRPIPLTSPPLWLGGGSEKAVARAAKYGDGWAPFFAWAGSSDAIAESALTSMEELRAKFDRLHDLRARAGRSGSFDLILAARHRLRPGTRDEADKYLESLSEMARVGVTWTTVQLRARDRRSYIERVQWFGEEVIARL